MAILNHLFAVGIVIMIAGFFIYFFPKKEKKIDKKDIYPFEERDIY